MPTVSDLQKRRQKLLQHRRLQEHKRQRLEAINHPERADLKPAMVTISEFAIATGLGRATIYRNIAAGIIPSVKLLRRRLIPFSYLEKLRTAGQ
jgi:excisionase family DNA binding protein